MKDLLEKYSGKLAASGMTEQGAALLGGLDAELEWNRDDPAIPVLEEIFAGLSINSLLFAMPAEPYRSIIEFLVRDGCQAIRPGDSETRTFLHDLPVVPLLRADLVIEALRRRKSVIVPGRGVVTWGTVSPEQAFIFFSSVCFSTFVKFFTDSLMLATHRELSHERRELCRRSLEALDPYPASAPAMMQGPFDSPAQVLAAVSQAGRQTVENRLVDSFFGNVSLKWGGALYISQTTSSLDELEGCIVPCPLDGSSCLGITASSELTAHLEVIRRTGSDGVLHGHPKFSVIMGMHCTEDGCPYRGECHVRCPSERRVAGVPVVPGEVGTGPTGLCNTLPAALEGERGAIVWGHGLFTASRDDLRGAFSDLLEVESECRRLCAEKLLDQPLKLDTGRFRC